MFKFLIFIIFNLPVKQRLPLGTYLYNQRKNFTFNQEGVPFLFFFKWFILLALSFVAGILEILHEC